MFILFHRYINLYFIINYKFVNLCKKNIKMQRSDYTDPRTSQ
jgi:hypothetical protein